MTLNDNTGIQLIAFFSKIKMEELDPNEYDDMVMLDTDFPLSSFSCIGMLGAQRSGKSYQSWNIMKQYEKVAKDKYDFDRMYDIRTCDYTHRYYISGSSAKL